MEYKRLNNVICLRNVKQASLYFDTIIPINYGDLIDMWADEDNVDLTNTTIEDTQAWKVLKDLSGGLVDVSLLQMVDDLGSLYINEYEKLIEPNFSSYKDIETKALINKEYIIDPIEFLYIQDYYHYKYGHFRDAINKILKTKNSIANFPIILPSYMLEDQNETKENISIAIANIPLIDTSKVSWNQILEVRHDKDSMNKLRNLRLFLHRNYQGKGLSFIENDLEKRIQDFSNVCRDYKFETITSVLTCVMNSKSLLASFATSLGAYILGETNIASVTALAGSSLEIGKIAIEIKRKNYAFNKIKRDHELAYIIETKEKLGV